MVIDSVAKFNHRKLRSAIKLPAQNFRHLRLFCFDYYALSWRFSNCLFATLSNLFQAHQKNYGLDYMDVRDTLVIFIIARRRP